MRNRWFGVVVAALAAAVSVWAYGRLPETVATHWSLQGTPDGYSSRLWAAAVMPFATLCLTGLFNVLPKMDLDAPAHRASHDLPHDIKRDRVQACDN